MGGGLGAMPLYGIYKMNNKIFLLILFLLIKVNYSQAIKDTLDCNLNVLIAVDEGMDSINNDLASEFFKTFDDSCKNKVEYSEWSNELLFQLLEKYPEKFLEVLSFKERYDLNNIFQNLESPIHDGINLERIYSRVKNTNIESTIKKEVLDRIQIAIGKK